MQEEAASQSQADNSRLLTQLHAAKAEVEALEGRQVGALDAQGRCEALKGEVEAVRLVLLEIPFPLPM